MNKVYGITLTCSRVRHLHDVEAVIAAHVAAQMAAHELALAAGGVPAPLEYLTPEAPIRPAVLGAT